MDNCDFPLSFIHKTQIIEAVFGQSSLDSEDVYFSYYERTVKNVRLSTLTRSHGNIASLVRLVKGSTRDDVEIVLRKQLLEIDESDQVEGIIDDAINLAVKLLLMISTAGLLSAGRSIVSGETRLAWKEGTLNEVLKLELGPETSLDEYVKFEKTFDARNLERIAGIKTRWTSNFADHLKMRDDDKAVELFHYASFLRCHENCSILPPPLIEETLRTLALLLPEHNRDVEAWFSAQQDKQSKEYKLPLDPLARECGQLKIEERQIRNFSYWHDRLVILKQAFDEAEPSSIKQWWRDRRKRVQWYTFWIAAVVLALTIFFGMVQSVEGAIQVYYAIHS
ncbi:hypothetical protein PVAG01_11125 [Phlyctema vagabunda]|uniref:Uncharacterized protein n=1 Tax=Phlyctema vagabunda TaxID=108571 RepID=A0ABR4P1F3_9HELO